MYQKILGRIFGLWMACPHSPLIHRDPDNIWVDPDNPRTGEASQGEKWDRYTVPTLVCCLLDVAGQVYMMLQIQHDLFLPGPWPEEETSRQVSKLR